MELDILKLTRKSDPIEVLVREKKYTILIFFFRIPVWGGRSELLLGLDEKKVLGDKSENDEKVQCLDHTGIRMGGDKNKKGGISNLLVDKPTPNPQGILSHLEWIAGSLWSANLIKKKTGSSLDEEMK